MKLLLDTHLLLWAAGSPDLLSESARKMLEDTQNKLFLVQPVFGRLQLSTASIVLIFKSIPVCLGEAC